MSCICALTAAAGLSWERCFLAQLPNGVAKARSRAMAALVDGMADAHAHLVSTRQRVLVIERAADGRSLVGHTKGYAQARRRALRGCFYFCLEVPEQQSCRVF